MGGSLDDAKEESTQPFSNSEVWQRVFGENFDTRYYDHEHLGEDASPAHANVGEVKKGKERSEAECKAAVYITESTDPITSSGASQQIRRKSLPGYGSVGKDVALADSIDTSVATRLPSLLGSMAIHEASSARLVFHTPDCKMIALPGDVLSDGDVVCVEQNTRDVNFDVRLPHPQGSLHFQLVYDPGNDACLFINYSPYVLSLAPVGSCGDVPGPAIMVDRENNRHMVETGLWTVFLRPNRNTACHVLDFLVLRRKFTVMMSKSAVPLALSGASKRTRDEDSQGGQLEAAKRTKAATVTDDITTVLFDVPDVAEEQASRPKGKAAVGVPDSGNGKGKEVDKAKPMGGSSVALASTPIGGANPMLSLHDGDVAVVRTEHSQKLHNWPAPAEYSLHRVTLIAETKAVSVFSADHSAFPGRVIAKIVKSRRGNLTFYARSFVHEVKFLKACDHRNIVKLMASDSRMFTILLEVLPPNLIQHPTPYQPLDARRVLHDVCAGLAYLSDVEIVHNDIKPANIAFSRDRGAVILDFGLANNARDPPSFGGTPWYVPPEIIDRPPTRGAAGDMWSMGVTMLFVLGKIRLPEKYGNGWRIVEVLKLGEAAGKMGNWIDIINGVRKKLDQTNQVESLVFQMLERKTDRISAGDVRMALTA